MEAEQRHCLLSWEGSLVSFKTKPVYTLTFSKAGFVGSNAFSYKARPVSVKLNLPTKYITTPQAYPFILKVGCPFILGGVQTSVQGRCFCAFINVVRPVARLSLDRTPGTGDITPHAFLVELRTGMGLAPVLFEG
jgi:hypothetical protein